MVYKVEKVEEVLKVQTSFTKYLTGGLIALGSTTLFWAIGNDPLIGYEYHSADLLLLPITYAAWKFRLLEKPRWDILIISGCTMLSILWSENRGLSLLSSIRLAYPLILLSSLRKQVTFVPLAILTALSIPFTIYYQLGTLNWQRGWGFSGNPNLLAGQSVILLLSLPLSWAIPSAISLALTGTRAGLLGLAAAGPLMLKKVGFKKTILFYGVICLIVLPNYHRFERNLAGVQSPSQIQKITAPNEREEAWSDAITTIKQKPVQGQGWDLDMNIIGKNPHSIYLIAWENLGVILGSVVIGLLCLRTWQSKNPALLAILVIGIFDHYWITTSMGIYPLAGVLAITEREIENEEDWRKNDGDKSLVRVRNRT